MSPEYGATCGFFPVDEETLRYLRLTGRSDERVALVEAYCKENLLWHDPAEPATYSQVVELDLADRRAVARRPAAAAGPDRALRREGLVPRGAAELRRRLRRTRSTRRSPSRSPPATRRRTSGAGRRGARRASRRSRRRRSPSPPCARRDRVRARRRDRPARPRRRRDRRDHVVHEHVEPVRDGRRRAAREEGGRARPRPAAVGEVEPRARLEGRHRVLRPGRPDAVPRGARLPHGRLRLHDLHRELRPAAGAGVGGDRGGRPRRLRRALREPELRGARASGGEGELPREPAARRRLRAGGADGRRPGDRAARPRRERRARLPLGPLALARGGPCDGRERDRAGDVRAHVRRRLHGRSRVARAARAGGGGVRVGRRVDLRPPAAVLRRHVTRAGRRRGHRRRPLPRLARRLRHDRPHLAGGVDQAGQPGREVPRRARGRARRLQLVRLAARQPRGDGARHVRERPAAQPARPRVGGHLDGRISPQARR